MSEDFKRSLFVSRTLRAHIRDPMKGRGGRRRGVKSKGEVLRREDIIGEINTINLHILIWGDQ